MHAVGGDQTWLADARVGRCPTAEKECDQVVESLIVTTAMLQQCYSNVLRSLAP